MQHLSLKKSRSQVSQIHFLWAIAILCMPVLTSNPSLAETVSKDYVFPAETVIVLDLSQSLNNRDNYIITQLGIPNITDPNSVMHPGLYGISSIIDSGSGVVETLTNSGMFHITINAGQYSDTNNSGYTTVYGYGIYSRGPSSSFSGNSILNDGDLQLTGQGISTNESSINDAGIYLYGISGNYIGQTANYGDLFVKGEGGVAIPDTDSCSAGASSYGLYSVYTGGTANYGTLEVSATGGTIDSSKASGGSSADPVVNTSAHASAYGILSLSQSGLSTLTNGGDILVTATGGTALSTKQRVSASASASGITHSSKEFINTGGITISATGGIAATMDESADAKASAFGLDVDTDGADVTNTGNITVHATGGMASSQNDIAIALAYAYGIHAASGGTLFNSGDITVKVTGGAIWTPYMDVERNSVDADAVGIALIYSSGTIINSGDIRVSATAGVKGTTEGTAVDTAYGIYISQDAFLTNTGKITANSTTGNAYEVYITSGSTTLLDTYHLTLDQDPARGSVFVWEDAALNLNNSALSISLVNEDTKWDTDYRIFDNYGTLSGNFSSVVFANDNPNVALTYDTQETTDPSDDTLRLSYGGNNAMTPFSQSTGAALNILWLIGNTLDQTVLDSFFAPPKGKAFPTLVAAADTTADEVPPGYLQQERNRDFFMVPFYADMHSKANPTGYHGRFTGTTLGFRHRTASAQYGFTSGFGSAALDYLGKGMNGNREEQDIYTLGVHAIGQINDWVWRMQVTGMEAQSSFHGFTGLDLTMQETVGYHTYGVSTTIAGGFPYRLGRHILMPEAGLAHTWVHRQGFTTEALDSTWNQSYDTLEEHQLTAIGILRWLVRMESNGIGMEPSLAAGAKKLLTDNTLSATGSMPGGHPFDVASIQDDVSITLNASLRFIPERNTAITLAYTGELGRESSLHSFGAKLSFNF